jgi:hypothetical protein
MSAPACTAAGPRPRPPSALVTHTIAPPALAVVAGVLLAASSAVAGNGTYVEERRLALGIAQEGGHDTAAARPH